MSFPRAIPDVDVDALVDRLDLETKVRLLSGADVWVTQPVPEIGLRSMTVSDGPLGVRGPNEDERDTSVALPSPSGLAASWDEQLLRRIGALLAGEAVRKGVDVVLGPTVNLHRSPLGGRHFECFREDPLLSGRLATAYVRGLQERGIGARPKHYVANDAETERRTVDNRVDDRTLRELYLSPFEAVVSDADPWMVMAAYNGVNGAPMTENDLLAEPLKGEWGFPGVVVSDWGALYDGEPAARAALDLAMPGPDEAWGVPLVEAVKEGRVAEADIDAKVRRLLVLAARTGALQHVDPGVAKPAPARIEDGAPLAREAAAAAAVLLRNDGVLPLRPDDLSRVALVGPGALDPRPLGGGSATVFPPYVVPPLTGLRRALEGRAEVVCALGTAITDGLRRVRPEETIAAGGAGAALVRWLDAEGAVVVEEVASTTTFLRSEYAAEVARGTDVAVVVVGTSDAVESEGFDRTSLALPGRQDELVPAVAAVNPRTVVVVNAGAPVELPWRDQVAAVLVAWFPGMEFGPALGDVLLGSVEPGRRLPTTWPAVASDAPVLNTTPNTGLRRGKQVVQVYASRPSSSVPRPARWLAGFTVVSADAGEVVDVEVSIHPRALRHWDVGRSAWAVEPGPVVLSTGPNAGRLEASVTVVLQAATEAEPA